ncbi:hypothetical protein BDF14DRAFT_1759667 [Spinellus fusiger]|nr:hypothetical protein BDF14DRAFT_1759667 [Spinellus fusiger]
MKPPYFEPLGASTYTPPNTRLSQRPDIDHEEKYQGTEENNSLMQQLLGNMIEIESHETLLSENTEAMSAEETDSEELFFPLFSCQPVHVELQQVDRSDEMSLQVASMQVVDHDETDPAFAALIAASVMDYDEIIKQSAWTYKPQQCTHRVVHVPATEQAIPRKKKRKSQQCRAFQRTVKEKGLQVEPKMRHPQTVGGWPGWPGVRTCFAIITKIHGKDLKKNIKREGSFPKGKKKLGGPKGPPAVKSRTMTLDKKDVPNNKTSNVSVPKTVS